MDTNRIIPIPKKYIAKEGKISLQPQIYCQVESWQPLVDSFAGYMQKLYDISFAQGDGGIQIQLCETLAEESYIIDVEDGIQILAPDYQGCAYALSTVLQMLDGSMELEHVRIEDKPDKDFRGLMVDLARHWHPYRTLAKYVDACFFYKIKYLHMHFMDDQSYTLPSYQFPKLSKPERSYTHEEIREFCEYAKARGVVIIPEVEFPGHASCLVRAYPELFGNRFSGASEFEIVTEVGGRIDSSSVICPGSQKVFSNVTGLIDEVLELFPDSPYVHLGADEVLTEGWRNCEECIAYMKAHNMTDTQELYAEFVSRVTNYVLSKGRKPIVWEGVAKEYNHWISKDVIVIAWECHYQMPDELLDGGFTIINGAWKPLYIVPNNASAIMEPITWTEKDILNWNVYEWLHWWEHSKATLNPFHVQPTDKVIGAELVSWEMTYECEIAQIVVRLAALSERVWSVKRYATIQNFAERLSVQMRKLFSIIA